ncbi:uncharacterized protein LOC111135617 isoform X2 [Crassostrea virginica]|nr:uncharacterized protein LOC111135562 isoform X2 [Crassostrea virginica]XP_022341553.1 uncharacterized protein LOC111135617 isoform X2 [Crassostrea virginica]
MNILASEGVYIEPIAKSSVRLHNLHKPFEDGHILSFEMNATSANGVVFYMASRHHNPNKSEFIALEVVDSYFRYHIKCSHLNAMLTVPRIVADDKRFHKISFQRTRSRGKLMIDGRHFFKNFRVECRGFRSIVFGGLLPEDREHTNPLQKYESHFEGCIRNVDTSTGVTDEPRYRAVSQCHNT